jgi:hypothetical protein
MVIISICLCRNILLGFLLRWHRELFFGWNTVGVNVGGLPEKFGWFPKHERERVLNTFKHKVRVLRDSNSPSRLHKFPKF